MGNKGGKKGDFANSTSFITSACQSSSTNSSAVDTISTLNNCSASIGEGCTVPTLPVDNTTLASCETKFAAVTTKNKECYDLLTATSPDLSAACTCWAAAATLVTETKKENCTAKASFDMIKDAKKACLSKFTGCKKAEDASIGLIHVCNGKTTPAPITTTPAPTTTAAPATTAAAPAPAPATTAAPAPATTAAPAPATTATPTTAATLLNRVVLSDYPLAKCNDG